MGGKLPHVGAVVPEIYPIGPPLGGNVKFFSETFLCAIYVLSGIFLDGYGNDDQQDTAAYRLKPRREGEAGDVVEEIPEVEGGFLERETGLEPATLSLGM
jgi:hypothetical protein